MLVALELAAGVLPRYASPYSRHDFTLPQLFAWLCCKELLGRTYRRGRGGAARRRALVARHRDDEAPGPQHTVQRRRPAAAAAALEAVAPRMRIHAALAGGDRGEHDQAQPRR
jgi:hypothetical protein